MYAATKDGLMLQISHRQSRGIVQPVKQKQKVFISCGVTHQLICAFFFSNMQKKVLSYTHTNNFYVKLFIYDVYSI